MKHQTSFWTLMIGAAIMSIMLMMAMSGNIAVKASTLATKNKIESMKMRAENNNYVITIEREVSR